MLLEVRSETKGHFLIHTVILGFLTIFKNCQASTTCEAVNSTCLSKCQSNVMPIFEMMWRPRAFSRVSTGDLDIPSIVRCKMCLHLSHCRKSQRSFESGRLGVLST